MNMKNERCPLQAECERRCSFYGREKECDYYHGNGRPGAMIDEELTATELEALDELFDQRDIDIITEEINFYKQQAGMAILEIGKRLAEAKSQLSHGEWLPWLEEKVEFSERSAQQYIRLWKEYGKSATVADLGVRKALVLLALPESEREGFAGEKHVVGGEEKTAADMTVKELEKAIAERNAAREEAALAKMELETARAHAEDARHQVDELTAQLHELRSRPTEVAVQQVDATEEQLTAARQEAEAAAARRVRKQSDLEAFNGITAEGYYLYKAATLGLTVKAAKLLAIDSLNLTAAQKDALYYSEGWAESKLHEAPWHGGQTAAVRMPVVKTTGGAPAFVRVAQSAPTVQMPVVRTTAKAPVFVRVTQDVPEAVRVVKMPVVK